jgi:hypothetical protein
MKVDVFGVAYLIGHDSKNRDAVAPAANDAGLSFVERIDTPGPPDSSTRGSFAATPIVVSRQTT